MKPTLIETIKATVPIIEAVERYTGVRVKRVRRSIAIRCPFHDDNHPSLALFPEINVWRCYSGCGGGDIVAFVARLFQLSMGEAARKIAEDYDIDASTASENPEVQKRMEDREIESDFHEQEQFYFLSLLDLEKRMQEAVKEDFEQNANVLHALPYISYLLDELVSGDIERRVYAVLEAKEILK